MNRKIYKNEMEIRTKHFVKIEIMMIFMGIINDVPSLLIGPDM